MVAPNGSVAGTITRNCGVGLAWTASENVHCGETLAAGKLGWAALAQKGPGWTVVHTPPVSPLLSAAVSVPLPWGGGHSSHHGTSSTARVHAWLGHRVHGAAAATAVAPSPHLGRHTRTSNSSRAVVDIHRRHRWIERLLYRYSELLKPEWIVRLFDQLSQGQIAL